MIVGGNLPRLGEDVSEAVGIIGLAVAEAVVEGQIRGHSGAVLGVERKDGLGLVVVGVRRVSEPDASVGGDVGEEESDRLKVVTAICAAGEELCQIVLLVVDAELEIVLTEEVGEVVLDLELLLLNEDRQEVGLADRVAALVAVAEADQRLDGLADS